MHWTNKACFNANISNHRKAEKWPYTYPQLYSLLCLVCPACLKYCGQWCSHVLATCCNVFVLFLLQQAYNAIAVSRQMKLMVLNSTNKSSRDNSCEREVPEEVRKRSFQFCSLFLVTLVTFRLICLIWLLFGYFILNFWLLFGIFGHFAYFVTLFS